VLFVLCLLWPSRGELKPVEFVHGYKANPVDSTGESFYFSSTQSPLFPSLAWCHCTLRPLPFTRAHRNGIAAPSAVLLSLSPPGREHIKKVILCSSCVFFTSCICRFACAHSLPRDGCREATGQQRERDAGRRVDGVHLERHINWRSSRSYSTTT
jgi:hypothetical protein